VQEHKRNIPLNDHSHWSRK